MAAQGVFGRNLTVGEGYAVWLNEEYERRVRVAMEIRTCTDLALDPRTPWDQRLFNFQRAGVAFLSVAECAVLADEMGTGKTVQSIMALRRLADYGHEVFPICVIAPNSTKGQWRTHWEEWFGSDLDVRVVGGSATQRRKALEPGGDVYVIHWEAVRLHSRLAPHGNIRLARCGQHRGGDPDLPVSRCEVHDKELNNIPFRSVIVDEAHKMKDPHAKQTRAVWGVQYGKHVRFRFSLTGTPIADHPGDLWALMHGVAPHEYPTKSSFETRYCLMSWDWGGGLRVVGINPQTRDEFFGFFDSRFRRMPKSLVLPFLPPVVMVRRDAPMGTKQARAYEDMRKKMMTETEDGELIVAKNNLAKYIRMCQFASATAEVDEAGNVQLSDPSPKLDVLEEILDEADGAVVVCAESRKLIELAAARLDRRKIPHHVLVGGLTDDIRTAMLRDLQDGAVRVLLFTMKAGGEGLNMTTANVMVRLERSWSMLLNYQTMARIHRIGSEQHSSITVVDVVAPGTIEERQFQVLAEKSDRLEEITRDRITLQAAGLSTADLDAEEQSILGSTLLP